MVLLVFFEFYGQEKLNRKIKASKAILRDNFWELTNVKILDNNLRPEIKSKTITITTTKKLRLLVSRMQFIRPLTM